MARTLTVTRITRHPIEAVAAIPMPERRTYVLAAVNDGRRQWMVKDYGGIHITVTPEYAVIQLPMRHSKLRTAIIKAVRVAELSLDK